VTAAEREMERNRSGNYRSLAVVSLNERFTTLQPRLKRARNQAASIWRYRSLDREPQADVSGAIARSKIPATLRTKAGEVAEVLVATSGVLAVVIIVLAITMMVRGIRSLRHS